MQRNPFPPPNAKSPELFHPRPQHISQVPMMRSPPPPVPQQQQQQQQPQMNSYGNPYASTPQQQDGGQAFGQGFGNFMTDPTAQMGFQVGKTAMMAGQNYMEQHVNRYVSVSALKHYFNVSNSYVMRKLLLVLLPWRHRPWNRQQVRGATVDGQITEQQYASMYLPPRDDINSPDMYIPIMALITYILLSTVLAGIRGTFRPEEFGSIATLSVAVIFVEILILKIAMYLMSINNDSQLMDLAAYSGYKFVGVIVTLFLAEILTGGKGTSNWIGWSLFVYTWAANAFFLLRSLKYVLLPDSANDPSMRAGASFTIARSQKANRTYFLAFYAYLVQLFFMWALTRDVVAPIAAKIPAKVAG